MNVQAAQPGRRPAHLVCGHAAQVEGPEAGAVALQQAAVAVAVRAEEGVLRTAGAGGCLGSDACGQEQQQSHARCASMQPSAISHQPARSPGGRADAHPVHLQLAPAPGERQRLWQALARLARLRGSTSLHAQAPALAPAGGMQAVCSNGISRWHRHQQHLPRSAACITATLGPGPMTLLPDALDAPPPTHTWSSCALVRRRQSSAARHQSRPGPRRGCSSSCGRGSSRGPSSGPASRDADARHQLRTWHHQHISQLHTASPHQRCAQALRRQTAARVGSHIDPTCCAARSARASPRS